MRWNFDADDAAFARQSSSSTDHVIEGIVIAVRYALAKPDARVREPPGGDIENRQKDERTIAMLSASVELDDQTPWRISVPKSCLDRHLPARSKRGCRVQKHQLTLTLRPREGGTYTDLLLIGPVPTAQRLPALRKLFSMLSLWNGWPISVVLCVDMKAAGWCEWWTDALSAVAAPHLEVCFHVSHGESDER